MIKLILFYMILHFIASVIIYEVNLIEYFFRLKLFWATFMIFPCLLLFKRNGLNYLIMLLLPVSVVSNILYILTAITGQAFLPDINITKMPGTGGIQIYRVFGGTFLGEVFFLGIIYKWFTDKFKFYQLFLAIIFLLPHILAFGRGAWVYFILSIAAIFIFNFSKKKNLRTVLKQLAVIVVLVFSFVFILTNILPESETVTTALENRVLEAESDIKYGEGTYGSRGVSQRALLEYWSNNNIYLGIGMHPFWVIKPETEDEFIYHIGYSDIRWAPFLVSYGLVGFALAIVLQITLIFISFKVLKKVSKPDLIAFLVLVLFNILIYDSFVYYSYLLITISVQGFSYYRAILLAALVYMYEKQKDS